MTAVFVRQRITAMVPEKVGGLWDARLECGHLAKVSIQEAAEREGWVYCHNCQDIARAALEKS